MKKEKKVSENRKNDKKQKYTYISISISGNKKDELIDYLNSRNLAVTEVTRIFYDFIIENKKLPGEIEEFFIKYNTLLENKWD